MASKTVIESVLTTDAIDVTPTTAIAVVVTVDKDGTPSLAPVGTEDSVLWYGAVRISKTEGLVLKFGNEKRILLDGTEVISWAPQKALFDNAETLASQVKHLSICKHTHDQGVTGLPVSWYLRVMKPGANSFSGQCFACTEVRHGGINACTGGTVPETKIGTSILGQRVARVGSCGEKREQAKAEAVAAREAKKAAAKAEAEARVAPAAEAAKPAPAKRTARKSA